MRRDGSGSDCCSQLIGNWVAERAGNLNFQRVCASEKSLHGFAFYLDQGDTARFCGIDQ